MLDVRRLRVLRAAGRYGSLSAAARELGYTQPAVSHHIARLEAEVGTPLLVRLGRGVRLTEAGAALTAHADEVLARLARAEEDVAAIAGLRAGRVGLVAFPSASATLVPNALAALAREQPGIVASFAEAEPPEALELLRAGDADVVVAFHYERLTGSDATAHLDEAPLLRDPLLAVVPKAHPLASTNGPIELAALADERWIAGCERCRGHLLHVAAAAGFDPAIRFATDDYVAQQGMIAAGLGVALLPALVLATVRHPAVAVLPVNGNPWREVAAVVSAGERRPPAVDALLRSLAQSAAALAAEAPQDLGLSSLSARPTEPSLP